MRLNDIYGEVITWFDGKTPLFNEVLNTINSIINHTNINVTPRTVMLRIHAGSATKIEDMDTVKIEDMDTTKIERLGMFGDNFYWDDSDLYLEFNLPIKLVKAIWIDAELWESRSFEEVKDNAERNYFHVIGNRIYFARDIKDYLEDDDTYYLTLLVEMQYSTFDTKDKETEFTELLEFQSLFVSGCVYKLGSKKVYEDAVGNRGFRENKDEYKEGLHDLHLLNLKKDNFGSYCNYGQSMDLGLDTEYELLPTEYQLLISDLVAGIVYIGSLWKIVDEAATGDLVTYKLIGGTWVEMARVS